MWYAKSEGSCNPAQDAGAGNTQCHGRRKCWFTRRLSKKPLFPYFLRDHKDSDSGLRRRPERYETTQTHIAHKPGTTPRFPFEFWVRMRSNSPLRVRSLHEARFAIDAIPSANPSKLLSPSQSREQSHLPSSCLGRAGNEFFLEGSLFDTISGVARHRAAMRFEGFRDRSAVGSAYPPMSIANS